MWLAEVSESPLMIIVAAALQATNDAKDLMYLVVALSFDRSDGWPRCYDSARD